MFAKEESWRNVCADYAIEIIWEKLTNCYSEMFHMWW